MKLSRNFLKRNNFRKSSVSQRVYSLKLSSGFVLYLIEFEQQKFVFRPVFTDTTYQGTSLFELMSILNRRKIYYEEAPITEQRIEFVMKQDTKSLLEFFKERISLQTQIIKS